jgi:hypothetical protein
MSMVSRSHKLRSPTWHGVHFPQDGMNDMTTVADLDRTDRPRRFYLPDQGTLGFQRLASVNIHAA